MDLVEYTREAQTAHHYKYVLKSYILNEYHDLYLSYMRAQRYEYLDTQIPLIINGQCSDINKYNRIKKTMDELRPDYELIYDIYINFPHLYHEIRKLHQSFKARRQRLRRNIEDMMTSGSTYFVTLTFNDETLNKTNEQTRRKYVTRFMDDRSLKYVGNIDYGDKNGREHYHVVFRSDDLDGIHYIKNCKGKFHNIDCKQFIEWNKYGFFSIEKCSNGDLDKYRLSVYVSKLTNHAIKNSTKQSRLIYSR